MYSDQALVLVQKYTVVAHRAGRESIGSAGGSTEGLSVLGGRKGQVVNNQRQWLGFGTLWQLLQDAEKNPPGGLPTKAPMQGILTQTQVGLVTDLLLELLTSDFSDEREIVLQRCLGNIRIGVTT